jgi:hypothetical protein
MQENQYLRALFLLFNCQTPDYVQQLEKCQSGCLFHRDENTDEREEKSRK